MGTHDSETMAEDVSQSNFIWNNNEPWTRLGVVAKNMPLQFDFDS